MPDISILQVNIQLSQKYENVSFEIYFFDNRDCIYARFSVWFHFLCYANY